MMICPYYKMLISPYTDLQTASTCAKTSTSHQQSEENSTQQEKLCLSFVLLLVIYGYLLYLYLRALYKINSYGLEKELDKLDKAMVGISLFRILLICFSSEQFYAWTSSVAVLCWGGAILCIFLRFVLEGAAWRWAFQLLLGCYLLYFGVANYLIWIQKQSSQTQPTTYLLYMPVFWGLMCECLLVTIIGVAELKSLIMSEENAFRIPQNILIELKNRKSFVFQAVCCSWLALLLRMFPITLIEVLGNVLYFVIADWIQLLSVYRCFLRRIEVKESDGNNWDAALDEQMLDRRDSNKIVIEMEPISKR